MKTKLALILSLSFLFSSFMNAQYSDFDLSEYKLPDIKTSSLDVVLDLNHNIENSTRDIDETPFYESRTRYFGGSFNAYLSHFRNSTKYQGSQTLRITYLPEYGKSVIDEDINKDNSNVISVYFSSINRFYNKSSNFIEVLPVFSYNFSDFYSSDDGDFEKSRANYLVISAPVSIGHGRIEPVQDARLAVYILTELSKRGKIINKPSESKILELAAEISKIKRKRFFDYRIRRIEELQAIDSFLVANNIVSSNDMIYFTQLSDQWDYAYGPARNSGFSVNFGFNNSIVLWNQKNETSFIEEDTTTQNRFIVGGFGKLQYSKPLNLYWQSDLFFELGYDYDMNRDPSDEKDFYNYNTSLLRPDLNYSIQFLPNSRTSVGLELGIYYQYAFGKRTLYDQFSASTVIAKFSENAMGSYSALDMNYYFSPRLRLQVYWLFSFLNRIDLMKSDNSLYNFNDKYDFLDNGLSVRLIYSFF